MRLSAASISAVASSGDDCWQFSSARSLESCWDGELFAATQCTTVTQIRVTLTGTAVRLLDGRTRHGPTQRKGRSGVHPAAEIETVVDRLRHTASELQQALRVDVLRSERLAAIGGLRDRRRARIAKPLDVRQAAAGNTRPAGRATLSFRTSQAAANFGRSQRMEGTIQGALGFFPAARAAMCPSRSL